MDCAVFEVNGFAFVAVTDKFIFTVADYSILEVWSRFLQKGVQLVSK